MSGDSVVPSRLFKYLTAEAAKSVIATGRLRWSSPLRFNDPFDNTQTLRLDFDASALGPLILAEMSRILQSDSPPPETASLELKLLYVIVNQYGSPEQKAKFFEGMKTVDSAPTPFGLTSFDALTQEWKNLLPRFRILCLSESVDVTPMWNHYADGYRGAVLEFYPDEAVDSALLLAKPVKYQDSPPAITTPEAWAVGIVREGGEVLSRMFKEAQYVKQTAWASEKEWRVVGFLRPGEEGLYSDWPFHPKELKAIYFGPSMSEEDKAELTKGLLARFPDAERYQVTIDKKATGFEIHKL